MAIGILYALIAGLLWGIVFVGPLLLPEYPAALQSVGRYLAFGLVALPLAWFDRAALRRLCGVDWCEALLLTAVGNFLYYICLASAIQRVGAPLPTVVVGALPVAIAVGANLRNAVHDGRMPWRRLVPSLLLIVLGIACVNAVELAAFERSGAAVSGYAFGAALAAVSLAAWTWYALRNARWLAANPSVGSGTWATAQGLVTLPLALVGYAALWGWMRVGGDGFAMPFGPRPLAFVGLMVAIGLFASWLGTLCWNQASQRLPTTLVGQLIVFETLAALAYAYLRAGHWPSPVTLSGVALLVCGVVWAARAATAPRAAQSRAAS